jgi:hypothetical protein
VFPVQSWRQNHGSHPHQNSYILLMYVHPPNVVSDIFTSGIIWLFNIAMENHHFLKANHLFLWAIYTMAMLVITRGYIFWPIPKSPCWSCPHYPAFRRLARRPSIVHPSALEQRLPTVRSPDGSFRGPQQPTTLTRFFVVGGPLLF